VNRLERLINLVAALLEADRPRTRAQIVELVPGYEGEPESVRRAFERDKDALRAMGIPLVLEPLDPAFPELGDGYRIPREQYELPDPGLAPDELAALQLAASTVPVEGGSGAEAIWKLGGVPDGVADGAPLAALPGGEHLATLFLAVVERRAVHFDYRGVARTVDPYRLSFSSGRWYLDGHDHGRGAERRFRLDRIESAPRVGDPGAFPRPPRSEPGTRQPWRMGDEDEVEALLLVDEGQAGWAVAKAGEGAVRERRPDGSVVLALGVTNRDAFRSFVLGFLDHAEVLGPPELRSEMVDWLGVLCRS
jgi:proteasome accessory factor B